MNYSNGVYIIPEETVEQYNGCQACFYNAKKQGFKNTIVIGNTYKTHIGLFGDYICFGGYNLRTLNFWIQRKAVKLIKKWWKRWFFIKGVLKIGKTSLEAKE